MEGAHGDTLPIFELPLAILPGELVPLHIFEDRYKRMIGHCVEAGEPFGIVFRDDDGGARRIGCSARVAEVAERFEDGRMNVVVAGEQPFRILERYEGPGWPTGEVELIVPTEDEEEGSNPDAGAAVREAFAELVEQVGGERPAEGELELQGSYEIAGRVELPADTKQRLLELRSEEERLEVLAAALQALVRTVQSSQEIAERAKMNGKVDIEGLSAPGEEEAGDS